MIRKLLSLAAMLIIGLLVYNMMFGDEADKENVKQITSGIKDLIQSTKEKYANGEYSEAIDKIGDVFSELKDKASKLESGEYADDIAALQKADIALPFVMIPKPHTRADIDRLDRDLPDSCGAIAPVMESGAAMLNAAEMFAHPRLTLALFGGVDYSADIGSSLSWDALLYARSHLAACAAMHGVHVFDVPYLDVRDSEGCEAETRRVKDIGIPARSAIHPAQIAPIHKVYTPTEDEIAAAERLLAAFEESQGGVALLDGKLIEAPLVKAAERILARKA